jgi:hypothetical protein
MDPVLSRDSRKVQPNFFLKNSYIIFFSYCEIFFILKIKKLVRSGIPESVRGKAWQFMACADRYRKPGVFDVINHFLISFF